MKTDLERIAQAWGAQAEIYIVNLSDTIIAHAGPSYAALTREQMIPPSRMLVEAWQKAFETDDGESIYQFGVAMGRRRADSHVLVEEIMNVVDIVRESIWSVLDLVYQDGNWNIAIVRKIEHWIHRMRTGVMSSYGASLQAVEENLAERERALEAQGMLIRELSTPIMPIDEGVLVVPLVGAIDSRRATQLVESVLEQIVSYQADVLILDVTGVPFIDTSVANYILQLARAVTLLGARIVLVGIGSEIAQTLVHLDVDLSSIVIRANLREGITYAFEYLKQLGSFAPSGALSQ